MKKLISLIALVTLVASCGGKKNNTGAATSTSNFSIEQNTTTVLYFHNERRCATCMAVENVTKEALQEKYNTAIPFYSLDLADAKNQAIMKKYGVGGQSLLVIKGDKSSNLTSMAFMNARSNPEKLKLELYASVESYQ